MGVLILISGPNGSGKSSFAEQFIGKTHGERYYIATMIPHTDDNYLRIDKHRRQREQFNFHTLELPYKIGDAPVKKGDIVLLEDVSNLLANNIFEKGNGTEDVFCDICKLLKHCGVLTAVTISGLESAGYDEETEAYINSLNELNRKLFDMADAAVSMQDNELRKGDIYDFV